LTFDPTSGVLDAGKSSTVTVNVSRTDLKPADYTDTIVFTSNAGERRTTVNMSVPSVSFTPTAFDFDATNTQATLVIGNTGGGSLSWSASKTQTWLTISPTSGFVKSGSTTNVTVTVSRTGLAPGAYKDTISLTTNGGNGTIPVSVQVAGLSFTPKTLDYGSTETQKTMTISNIGEGTLNWNATNKEAWLTITPASGSVNAGQSATVTVSVSKTDLPPGSYSDTISLTSNGGNGSVPVTMAIPQLSILTTFLSYGTIDTQKTFMLSNTGGGVLTWNASVKEAWLSIDPSSGTVDAGKSTTITVTVSRTDLLPNSYTDKVVVTSDGGNDSVTIIMGVAGLVFTPTSLAFTATETQKTMIISNSGPGTLVWQASDNQPWLTLSPQSGSTDAGKPTTVTVTVSRTGLTPGGYSAIISLTSNGGTGQVPVTMIVANPTPFVSPASLNFGTTGTNATFQISNTGAGTLNWNIDVSKLPAWLNASPTSGATVVGTPSTVSVTVSRTGLNPATYNTTIPILTNGGNVGVPVTMTVPNPELSVSPSVLNFGSTTTQDSFIISNSGGGTLIWGINRSNLPAWLILDLYSGSTTPEAPSEVFANINRAIMDPGSYNCIITITSNGGTKTVLVTMTVPGPILNTNPTSLNFGRTTTILPLTIINEGGGTLSWIATANSNPNWLSLSFVIGGKDVLELQGTTGPYSSTIIYVYVSRDLLPGTYNGTISISSNGGTKSVPVTLVVPLVIPLPGKE
jgi:hypothetical protein